MKGQNDAGTEVVFQAYRDIIKHKQVQATQGKIMYDWKLAEESIVQDLEQLSGVLPFRLVMEKINLLQQSYMDKFIPASYSYYHIKGLLVRQSHSLISNLQEQLIKVSKGQSQYQQVAIQLTLEESLYESIRQKQSVKQDACGEMKQLIHMHIVSIIKINGWQQKYSNLLGFPVFFIWNERPYLISINSNDLGEDSSSFKMHIQIQKLFTKSEVEEDKDLYQQCVNIIKAQKSRELELVFKLPFFASVRIQKTSPGQTNIFSKVKANMNYSNKFSLKSLKKMNQKIGLQSLGSEELQVIKRFRSLKNVKRVSVAKKGPQQNKKTQYAIDLKVHNKLNNLKQRVKQREKTTRSRQVSLEQVKPSDRTIRILFQKQVDLNDSPSQISKIPLNTLSLLPTIQKMKSSRAVVRPKSKSQLEKIQSAARQLAASLSKKQQQMQLKDNSLKSLKLQLISRVKEKKPISRKTGLTGIHYSTARPIGQLSQRCDTEMSVQVIREKAEKEGEKEALLVVHKQASSAVEKAREQLQVKGTERERNERRLREKMQRVGSLKQRLQLAQINEVEPEAKMPDEFAELRVKRQMDFEYQRKKVSEISQSLEERVRAQEMRHSELKRREEEREREVRQRIEREVETMRRVMERESNDIKLGIQLEERRRRQYEEKIEREREQNERMIRQIQEWEARERQLLVQIQENNRVKYKRQEEQRLLRKQRLDVQIREMQIKQSQVLNEYKSANQNMMSMLQLLRQKNAQIEKKISVSTWQ